MSALIVDRRDARLSLQADTLVIAAADGSRAVLPVARIERVIVRSPATIETSVLARLWSQGSGLLVLSGRRNEPTARFLGKPHNDASRRLAQYALQSDGPAKAVIAKRLIAAKLASQTACLAELAARRPAVRPDAIRFERQLPLLRQGLDEATNLDRLRGLEGAAAAAYWPAYAAAFADSLGMSGRNRRPPRDPVNVALSLAYTMAMFEASRQAQVTGLDPMLGALHAPSFGRESLACDLVEPLRPRLDLWVFELFAKGGLRPEHFTRDSDGRCLMGKAGRGLFYGAIEERMPAWSRWARLAARDFARHLPAAAPAGQLPGEALEIGA